MEVTLRELLKARIFKRSEPVAGIAELDRTVTSINILDGFSGCEYTKAGTFVITSGYFLSVNMKSATTLLEELVRRGGVGIAFKPKYFNGIIPQELIEKAEALHFPLIALDNDEAAFGDFFVFFDSNVYCRGIEAFLRKDNVTETFIKSMRDGGLPKLSEQLSGLSGRSVTALFEQENYSYPASHANTSFSRLISDYSNKTDVRRSDVYNGMSEYRHMDRDGRALFGLGVELDYMRESIGAIWLDCTERPADENDVIFLQTAKLACELEIKQILNYQQEESRLRAKFIEQLLSGRLHSWHEAVLLTKGLNWRIPAEIRVLVMAGPASAPYQEMEMVVSEFFQRRRENIVVYPYDQTLVLLLPSDYTDNMKVLEQIRALLRERFPKTDISFGLGRKALLQNVHNGYSEALYAAKYGPLTSPSQGVYEFDRLGFYRLFCTAVLPNEYERFFHDYMDPVLELDSSANLSLVDTLRTYFECQCNFSRTARALYLQPNAVRYRLSVVEKACNIDFFNPNDVFNLQMALSLMPFVVPSA